MRHDFDGSQQELFPDLVRPVPKKKASRDNMIDGERQMLVLSYENAAFVGIGIILAMVICFSLGVERGKRIGRPVDEKINIESEAIVDRADELVSEASAPDVGPIAAGGAELTADVQDEPLSKSVLKRYTIQLAAFKKKVSADEEIRRLKRQGYDAFCVIDNNWFQVRTGSFLDIEEARAVLSKLKDGYSDAYVKIVKGGE